MFRRLTDFLAVIFALIVGVLLAAASFFWFLLPKARKEERERLSREADDRAEAMKSAIAKAHEERKIEVEKNLADLDKKTEDLKKEDSVDIANRFLKES